ncbi:MAG: Ger(x)C family spore germination protein [Sporomusaceae bacterium]|nr:Ger(x)C family spore germination protein [Sporomusaceae bacterium]
MKSLQKCLIGCCIFCVFLISGCNGSREAEQNAYVIAIGIDKGENQLLEVTYQIARPVAVSAIEQGGSSETSGDKEQDGDSKKEWVNITVSGFSVAETRNELKSTLALIPIFNHTKFIVLGEELAKDGIGDIIISLIRFQEYRGSMYVAVTSGSAKNFLNEIRPGLSTFLYQWYELMMQTDSNSGYFPGVSLHQLYRTMKSEGQDSYITFVAPNRRLSSPAMAQAAMEASASTESPNSIEPLEAPHQAGDLPRSAGNPIEVIGAAVFHGDKLAGILKSDQVRIKELFLRHLENGFVSVKDPLVPESPKGINFRYRAEESPKVTTAVIDGKPSAHIHLVVECELTGITSGIHYEDPTYQKLLEDYLSNLFTRDLLDLIQATQTMNSDILGIGDYFRPNFATLPAYKKFHWRELYKDAAITGEVECKIRRSGLMVQTSPIQK